jgi:hypothetical protein
MRMQPLGSTVLAIIMLVGACGGTKPAPTIGNEAAAADTQPTTIAVALVYSAFELYIGNDKENPDIPEDDPSRAPGMLIALRDAIDAVNWGGLGPEGSRGVVITYADRAQIRVPLSPLSEIRGSMLGTQKDYYGTTGLELVAGVQLAMVELKKASVSRRAIIIVGDGNDTNNEAARANLEVLKREAMADGIEVYAIIWKSSYSNEENVVSVLDPDVMTVNQASGIGPALEAITQKLRR